MSCKRDTVATVSLEVGVRWTILCNRLTQDFCFAVLFSFVKREGKRRLHLTLMRKTSIFVIVILITVVIHDLR